MSMTFLSIAIVIMLFLLLGGVWIAFSIGIGGFLSLYPILKQASPLIFGVMSWDNGTNFILVAIPLFVFMGEYISRTGMTDRLYRGAAKVITGMPGGLVQTNIIASAIFAACSGSAVACAATMSKVAYPEQVLRRGYHSSVVLGSIAAGGTVAILIPPSIFFIVYGSIADQSVGKLYLAGVIPGLVMCSLFMIYVAILSFIKPKMFPKKSGSEASNWKTRVSGLKDTYPFLILIFSVIGSIYLGVATPTEAAGVGAAAAVLMGVFWRLFTWKDLIQTGLSTVKTSCMIFLILINAKVVSVALGYYGVPNALREFAHSFGNPIIILLLISFAYLILGTIFEDFSLMLLLLPFVLPLVQSFGYDLLWFGVYMCILLQAGLISPPVGLNLFVIQGATGVSLSKVSLGCLPFFVIMLLMDATIAAYPQVVMWLPGL